MPATRIGRPPMRPARTPAIGATNAGIAVHGSVRRPDWNGLRPWTTWKNWTRRNTAPKTPKYIRNETALAALKPRLRKKRSGSIGDLVRDSQTKNSDHQDGADRQRAEDLRVGPAELVAVDDAPHEAEQAGADEPQPGAGRARRPGRRTPRGGRRTRMTATMPIGTLSQKIQCHETPSAMAPPTSGPMAMARPAMPPHAPRATARRSGGTARGQDRQAERRDEGAADALDRAGDDEDVARGREGRGGRAGGEDRQADDEHPAATEPVAERGAGEQQDGERQRVGVDHPLELGRARRRGRAG